MDAEREMKSKLLSAKKAGKIEEIVETLSLQDKEQALIVAAECGFTEVVKYLIDQGIIFHDADSCQKNMLHILLSSFRSLNEPGLLQYVVKIVNNGVDVNQLNENNDKPISIAAKKGLYDVVRYLLEQGADVHYGNSYQDNFLHMLFYYYGRSFIFGRCDLLQCVVRLIDAGVDVNQLNKDKVTPIVIAAWRGLYDVLVYMLEHGGNKHCVDSHQNNLLYILLSKFQDRFDNKNDLLRCVIKLVDAGVDVNQLNGDEDYTPILMASRKGLCDIVIYLLEHEVDVHCVDSHQNNLMHLLVYSERERKMGFNVHKIQSGHFGTNVYSYASDDNTGRRDLLLKCVVKLVDAGVDVNQSNKDKETPIVIAAKAGLCDVVMCLLEQGVDSCQNNLMILLLKSYSRYYPHANKGRRDLLPCVVKLMDAGVDVNQVNEDIVTPLSIATIEGLYEPGVDANLRHEGKDTPIFIAARKGLYEVVIYLLEHGGVDVKYVDSHQDNLIHTLLYYYDSHYTICSRDLFLQCVVRLVDAGVDVNEPNKYKDTPISIVARKGMYEVVLYLLYHGVDVHYVDSHQKNLIHILLDSYHRYDNTIRRNGFLLPCIVKLVDDGVDVNQPNGDKETPIFIAAREGLSDVVIYLLQNGVDVHYVDDFKLNILHYMLLGMYSSVQDEEKTISLVNTLINMGSHINQSDHKGNTPLFYVGRYNHSDDNTHLKRGKAYEIQSQLETGLDMQAQMKCKLINILLEAGCNANHQNEDERTALMHHIKHQADICILKQLIPYSDLSLTDNNGNTAISCCVQYHMFNSTIVFKLLVDSGSDLMSRNNGVKLFHDILKCKRFWMFNYYIRLKLIVNGVTAEGENMLHLLARVNYDYSINQFNWLLNSELDVNHPCFKANTPTMTAAFLLNSTYLELLTRHPRLDINAQNNQGHTSLHLCIIGFTMFKDGLNTRQVNDVVANYCRLIYPIYMACIDTLLGVDGIDVNIKDHRGRTSLMMAAMKNDRVLTRKLLQTGAIVSLLDYSGRSALQYLDIYQSVFDLTCFKLLLSNGNTGLLNIPCIDGNTIIQTALCFPFFWEPCRVVRFIRYLVAENSCVQTLVTSSVESSYKQINLTELSSSDRGKLRKLLYFSGAPGDEIITILKFDDEDKGSQDNDTIRARGKEQFVSFCSSISLKSLCRRIIRQNLRLEIKAKVKDLELPYELNGFLLLADILHPQDYNLDHIDDLCNDFDDDDDYDGYDIDDRDDDYSQYNYQYFTLNTDHELRQSFKENFIFPNGGHGGLNDDDNDCNADDDYSIYGYGEGEDDDEDDDGDDDTGTWGQGRPY